MVRTRRKSNKDTSSITDASSEFLRSKNAEQVEWWITVEGHFDFDVFDFIKDVLRIREEYFIYKNVQKEEGLGNAFKNTLKFFFDDQEIFTEDKLRQMVGSYKDIFQPVSIRNEGIKNFLKKYCSPNNWPRCIEYKQYGEL